MKFSPLSLLCPDISWHTSRQLWQWSARTWGTERVFHVFQCSGQNDGPHGHWSHYTAGSCSWRCDALFQLLVAGGGKKKVAVTIKKCLFADTPGSSIRKEDKRTRAAWPYQHTPGVRKRFSCLCSRIWFWGFPLQKFCRNVWAKVMISFIFSSFCRRNQTNKQKQRQ